MKLRIPLALGMLAALAMPACAQEPLPSLPPIQVAPFIAECAHTSLPSQRLVEEWTGLHNFGQVYAARERLMARIGRACQQPGVDRVQLVMHPGPRHGVAARFVASEIPGR